LLKADKKDVPLCRLHLGKIFNRGHAFYHDIGLPQVPQDVS